MGFTMTIAIFWSLAFESPITILEKYLFGQMKEKPPAKIENFNIDNELKIQIDSVTADPHEVFQNR